MQLSNFNSVHNFSDLKASPNLDETLYGVGYNIIKPYIYANQDTAWMYDSYGYELAATKYQAINILYYLVTLGMIVRRYKEMEGTISDPCATSNASAYYNLPCVESHLSCISKTFGIPYTKIWSDIKSAFGLTCMTGNGIGVDIINQTYIVQNG